MSEIRHHNVHVWPKRRAWIAFLGLLTIVLPALIPARASAVEDFRVAQERKAPAKNKATAQCNVHVVLAQKQGDGSIPDNLKFIEAELSDDLFAAYESFTLLEVQGMQLSQGEPGSVNLKTGQQVKLVYLGREKTKLKLDVEISSKSGKKTHVVSLIENNGVLLFGGLSYKGGKLFFPVQCAVKDGPS